MSRPLLAVALLALLSLVAASVPNNNVRHGTHRFDSDASCVFLPSISRGTIYDLNTFRKCILAVPFDPAYAKATLGTYYQYIILLQLLQNIRKVRKERGYGSYVFLFGALSRKFMSKRPEFNRRAFSSLFSITNIFLRLGIRI